MNFKQELEEKAKRINDMLVAYLPKQEGLQERVIDAMDYSVNAGGKRIRPMIMLETFKLCNGKKEELVRPFMAALECIHTYSLVHDDLPAMDNDDYRRGRLTTHKKYGEDFGVLAGDALLNYAYELIFDAMITLQGQELAQSAKAAAVIAKKAGIYGMVGGQSLDVWLTDKAVDAHELEFIFNLKTGALIEAAFMVGAILAGADAATVEALEKAGNRVGVAFQIKDDILDVVSTQEVLGKPVLSDERNNKTTYVSLYGMEKAQTDVKAMSQEAIRIIEKTGNNPFLAELVLMLINREK